MSVDADRVRELVASYVANLDDPQGRLDELASLLADLLALAEKEGIEWNAVVAMGIGEFGRAGTPISNVEVDELATQIRKLA